MKVIGAVVLLLTVLCEINAQFGLVDLEQFNQEDCRRWFEIQDRQIVLLKQGKYSQLNNDNFRCFLKCGLEKLGVIDGSEFSMLMGTLASTDVTQLTPNRQEQEILNVVKSCLNVQGRDGCVLAFRFVNCVHFRAPFLGTLTP